MAEHSRRPGSADLNRKTFEVVQIATGEAQPSADEQPAKNPAAVAVGRQGGQKGGAAQAAKMTPKAAPGLGRKAAAQGGRARGTRVSANGHLPHAEITLRVLVFRGSKKWIAQCLDFDFGVQADSQELLPARFLRAIQAEIAFSIGRSLVPFRRLPKAPQRFWNMWDRGRELQTAQWAATEGIFPPGGAAVQPRELRA